MLSRPARGPAIVLCVAGLLACLAAVAAEPLGLSAEQGQSTFGWKQAVLLGAGIAMIAAGAGLLAGLHLKRAGRRWQYRGSAALIATGVPTTVWLITAVFGALLLFYSVLMPTYRGPDEPLHVDLVLQAQTDWTYPSYDGRETGESVIGSLDEVQFGDMSRELSEDEVLPASERPPLDDLTPNPGSVNQLPQHPPLYYYGLAAVNTVFDALTPGSVDTRPFDQTVSILRFFNLLLLLPLPALCFLLARRLAAPPEGALAAALLPLAIPQLTHIGATVNNDNLLTLTIGALTLLLVMVAQGDLRWRISLAIGLLTGVALLTKGFALFIPALIAAAYLVALLRGAERRPASIRAAVALGVAAVTGGWWWLRNYFVLGELQPGVDLLPPAPEGFSPDPIWWTKVYLGSVTERFWGWFGWFDVRVPVWLIVLATAVTVIGVLAAFLRSRLSREPGGIKDRRIEVLFAIAPLAALFLMTAVFAYGGYADTGLTPSMQGRYLFPGVVGLAAVAGLGLARIFGPWNRFLPAFTLGFVALAQLVGMLTALDFYWAADGSGLIGRLESMYAWIPWPGAISILAAAAAAVAIGALIGRVVQIATSPAPEVSRPDPAGPDPG